MTRPRTDAPSPLEGFQLPPAATIAPPQGGLQLQVLGCSYREAGVDVRAGVSFDTSQADSALLTLRNRYPRMEVVLLSTCNRTEFYLSSPAPQAPSRRELAESIRPVHAAAAELISDRFWQLAGREAVRHLFLVASSLDSMVVGEPQILAQVKQAYALASRQGVVGPRCHAAFQAALRTAHRVAGETNIHCGRLSVPSVAVVDVGRQIFERFDDKQTLVIGAGEMARETLKYLRDLGARRLTIINRSPHRAAELAAECGGRVAAWDGLLEALVPADLVVSTTGARQPIVTAAQFVEVLSRRGGRPLFILDLAMPRDFDPAVGRFPNVYLYCLDDLEPICAENRRQRARELPLAMKIVEQEVERFLGELTTRDVVPFIRRLREDWQQAKQREVQRLFHKLPGLNERSRQEIDNALERLLNKLLHSPTVSLRDESRQGAGGGLLQSFARLFRLDAPHPMDGRGSPQGSGHAWDLEPSPAAGPSGAADEHAINGGRS